MNTKYCSRYTKLLVSALRRSKKRPHGSNSRERSSAAGQATPRARRSLIRGGQNRRAIRVKVVLTRVEAAQLLSLTAHGHRTAAQVVAEIMMRRQATAGSKASTTAQVNTAAPPSTTTAWRPVLESIPEE
ncbi:hypothetical protein HU200_020080 [Digitaria exilis]|uniref:Uncharacterized protein n=1 Tax=Digitaria exilis TaxID=1010633 RepID=A0A835F1B2_9POAL|nr:hypothetical protein HU200_020080 [Digitaria exilis]CAB3463520.1 unnamed protein product [Digitaria exilis]